MGPSQIEMPWMTQPRQDQWYDEPWQTVGRGDGYFDGQMSSCQQAEYRRMCSIKLANRFDAIQEEVGDRSDEKNEADRHEEHRTEEHVQQVLKITPKKQEKVEKNEKDQDFEWRVKVQTRTQKEERKKEAKTKKKEAWKYKGGGESGETPKELFHLFEARSNDLSAVGQQEWVEVEATVDSGACDTVMSQDECKHIDVVSSEKSRAGFQYEVANGQEIPNQGERRCEVMTENSRFQKQIHFQVADVHKTLLSVTKCADMGFMCVLGKTGGYLEDTITGEKIPVRRKGNLYVIKMWVRQSKTSNNHTGFAGRG